VRTACHELEEPRGAGCGYVIWKRVAGRTSPPEVARQLIENGRTNEVLSGSVEGRQTLSGAHLVLNVKGRSSSTFRPRANQRARVAE